MLVVSLEVVHDLSGEGETVKKLYHFELVLAKDGEVVEQVGMEWVEIAILMWVKLLLEVKKIAEHEKVKEQKVEENEVQQEEDEVKSVMVVEIV